MKFGFWLKLSIIYSWHALCDFTAMKHQAGRGDDLEFYHGLESVRARQMWLEIICDGKISPIKPKCNVAHGLRRRHAKPKCTSAHGRRMSVEKKDQTSKAKCINSLMQKGMGCDNRRPHTGRIRIRLRQKGAERFMYADQATRTQSGIDVQQN